MAETPAGTSAQWLEDRILRGAIGAARALPYAARVPAFGAAMASAIGPLAGYRRRAQAHLGYIWPDMPPAERRRISRAALDNAGRTLIENYSGEELAARLAATPPSGPGLAELARARDAGRPVIFVTGHFGNYEAPRHVLHRGGFRIGGLYRPMRNPYFNAHYAATMEAVSGPVFPQGRDGTRGFVRHLRSGGMATLLFDVYDAAGADLTFLGRPAKTSLSAAELALRYDALLVPYFGVRHANGLDFRIEIDAPIPHSTSLQMMQAATQALERRILAHPEQWFWVHRRWKPYFEP